MFFSTRCNEICVRDILRLKLPNTLASSSRSSVSMRSTFVMALLLCSTVLHSVAGVPPLRKLTVLSSNNHLLDKRYGMISLPPSTSSDYFKKLRSLVKADAALKSRDEMVVMRALRRWTSDQWVHDGRFAPSMGTSGLQIYEQCKQGVRFNCEGYSRLLLDMLLAHGIVARVIYMKTKVAPYAAPGQGHVAVCAWSHQYREWVFLDAQYDGEVTVDGKPLSWIDVADILRREQTQGVSFTASKCTSEFYREFLKAYTGYVSSLMVVDDVGELVTFQLDSTAPQYFTFQGLPSDGTVFTQNRGDFNMPLGGTSLVFYSQNPQEYSRVLSTYHIITADDYMRYMALFTASPDFTLRLSHAMPWFKTFESSIDGGPWTRVKGTKMPVHFHLGSNELRVRAVNEQGWAGSVTTMVVLYE